jgi:hypothetical protein
MFDKYWIVIVIGLQFLACTSVIIRYYAYPRSNNIACTNTILYPYLSFGRIRCIATLTILVVLYNAITIHSMGIQYTLLVSHGLAVLYPFCPSSGLVNFFLSSVQVPPGSMKVSVSACRTRTKKAAVLQMMTAIPILFLLYYVVVSSVKSLCVCIPHILTHPVVAGVALWLAAWSNLTAYYCCKPQGTAYIHWKQQPSYIHLQGILLGVFWVDCVYYAAFLALGPGVLHTSILLTWYSWYVTITLVLEQLGVMMVRDLVCTSTTTGSTSTSTSTSTTTTTPRPIASGIACKLAGNWCICTHIYSTNIHKSKLIR